MFLLLLPIVLPIVLPIELPINRLCGCYVMILQLDVLGPEDITPDSILHGVTMSIASGGDQSSLWRSILHVGEVSGQ